MKLGNLHKMELRELAEELEDFAGKDDLTAGQVDRLLQCGTEVSLLGQVLKGKRRPVALIPMTKEQATIFIEFSNGLDEMLRGIRNRRGLDKLVTHIADHTAELLR